MKTKKHHAADLYAANPTRDHEAQQEIDSFLRAVRSYPDRFAREPYLSFQQHLSRIATADHPPSTDK